MFGIFFLGFCKSKSTWEQPINRHCLPTLPSENGKALKHFFCLLLHHVGAPVGSCPHPITFPRWLHALAQEAKGTQPWSWHPKREFCHLFCKCTTVGTLSARFGHDAVLSAALKALGLILGFSPGFAASPGLPWSSPTVDHGKFPPGSAPSFSDLLKGAGGPCGCGETYGSLLALHSLVSLTNRQGSA